MVSLTSRAVIAKYWLTRRKKIFSDPVALRRSAESGQSESAQVPNVVRSRYEVTEQDVRGHRCYTLHPRHLKTSRHVFYLHGGAYVHQIEHAHWRFLMRLLDLAGCRVTVPIYPLAPSYTYEDTLPMVWDSYESTVAVDAPDDQVLMGDSAGGALSLFVAQRRKQCGLPQPGRIVLISPWLDITLSAPDIPALDPDDPFLSPRGLEEAADLYAGDLDRRDPRVSPIYGDLTELGRITLFVGTRDILLSDARRFRDLASQRDVPIDYVEYPGMFHGWILQSIPEARSATEYLVQLL